MEYIWFFFVLWVESKITNISLPKKHLTLTNKMGYQWNWTTLTLLLDMKIINLFCHLVDIRHEVYVTENRLDLDIGILSQKETIISLMSLFFCMKVLVVLVNLLVMHPNGSLPLITSHIKSWDSRSRRIMFYLWSFRIGNEYDL